MVSSSRLGFENIIDGKIHNYQTDTKQHFKDNNKVVSREQRAKEKTPLSKC